MTGDATMIGDAAMIGDCCEIVITAPNADWLVEFSRHLVEDRLCASAQNISPIRSVYRWHNQIHDRTEARVALRTRLVLLPHIVARTIDAHPYEVPGIVALPIVDGSAEYIQWIRDETSSASDG